MPTLDTSSCRLGRGDCVLAVWSNCQALASHHLYAGVCFCEWFYPAQGIASCIKQRPRRRTRRTSCSGDSKSSKSPCTTRTSPHMPFRNSRVDCSDSTAAASRGGLRFLVLAPYPAGRSTRTPPLHAYLGAQVACAQYLVDFPRFQ